ncbi:MAG: hypothetical protein QM770_21970 [Tepidisphaeraceae bacterium]
MGLSCPTVTGAGTGTFRNEASSGVYTELQAGSYAFMDVDYATNQVEGEPFEHSLFVLSSVMSVTGKDFVVLDAGLKSMSGDSGLPSVWNRSDLTIAGLSDEHTKVMLAPTSRRPKLRDRFKLLPSHCDPTINLHDEFVCIRNDHVEAIWKIGARGMSW